MASKTKGGAVDASKDKLDVLIIADNFNQKLQPLTEDRPLGLFNVASVSLLDMTLEWVSRIDANVYIAISEVDQNVTDKIKEKWKYYVNVEILMLKNCYSFGDMMRAVDRLHLFTKEFILIENVPTFCSSRLNSHLDSFKALRKDRTTNGKTILGKDNLMTILCSRTKQARIPLILEKSSNRLMIYNPESVALTMKLFANGCLVRSDLKPTGIYFCAPEIITKFSDNIDAQTFVEQIGNIVAQDETICEYIYVDVLPETVFADTASDIQSLYDCLFSFLHQKYYPCTFDALHPDIENWGDSCALQYRGDYVFLRQKNEVPKNTNNSVFGGSFKVGDGSVISGCFLGEELLVGKNSTLSQVIVGQNVTIGDNVKIKRAIIGDNVQIKDGSTIEDCLLSGNNERVSFKTTPTKRADNRSKSTSSMSMPTNASDITLGGLSAFDAEIRESIRNSLASSDWNDIERLKSLVLEINSSKIAYNIQMDDVTKHIFSAFMEQTRFGPSLNEMKSLTNGWKHVWSNYYKSEQSQRQILHAIEEHVSSHLNWLKFAPNYVLFLYNDIDLLSDDIINEWFETLNASHPLKSNEDFKKFITWINEDEEDSDEEEE